MRPIRPHLFASMPATGRSPRGQEWSARPAQWLDVAPVLELVRATVEVGCRTHYSPSQRQAVYLTYATTLFVDVLAPLETWLIESPQGQPLAMAQLDPARGRLRALFVTPEVQGRGLGRTMLGIIESAARRHGLATIHGSMSLNAVTFYRRVGFEAEGSVIGSSLFGVRVPVQPMRKRLSRPMTRRP